LNILNYYLICQDCPDDLPKTNNEASSVKQTSRLVIYLWGFRMSIAAGLLGGGAAGQAGGASGQIEIISDGEKLWINAERSQ